MTVTHQRPRRSPRSSGTAPGPVRHISSGFLALTAAMYPDGEAVSAEILELKGVVSWGRDLEHAFAMVTEAAECIVGACATSAADSIARLAEDNGLTVYGRPPRTYRPAAIPSHLLKKPGLILRPVSIDIEAASRD